MEKERYLSQLEKTEQLALGSRMERFLHHPIKYFWAIFYREFVYAVRKKSQLVKASTFFGKKMYVNLPAGTDIYLTGGKSDFSEIRLARFLLKTLREHSIFIDVGAHYGYFTLLASSLVGKAGRVYAFEASPTNYAILLKNAPKLFNTVIQNIGISDKEESIRLFEFPNLHSEYNTTQLDQFKQEEWFQRNTPIEINIQAISLGFFFREQQLIPDLIKIDVEGAEDKVIRGMVSFLASHQPIVILEFLSQTRGNEAHHRAADLLFSCGYQAHSINSEGTLEPLSDGFSFLDNNTIESDNIVFTKG